MRCGRESVGQRKAASRADGSPQRLYVPLRDETVRAIPGFRRELKLVHCAGGFSLSQKSEPVSVTGEAVIGRFLQRSLPFGNRARDIARQQQNCSCQVVKERFPRIRVERLFRAHRSAPEVACEYPFYGGFCTVQSG
jgi:hypothetical protein